MSWSTYWLSFTEPGHTALDLEASETFDLAAYH